MCLISCSYIMQLSCVGCSGCSKFTSSSGTFTDGSGAADYANDAACEWIISSSASVSKMFLSFKNFATEPGKDNVTVSQCYPVATCAAECSYTGDLAVLSGTKEITQVFSTENIYPPNSFKITFASNSKNTGAGFTATWSSVSSTYN